MSTLLEALRTRQPLPVVGIFGQVLQRRMRCPSDADPGADDLGDDEAGALAQISEARALLAQAEDLIQSREPGALLAAQSRMAQAAGWLKV